MPYRIAMIVFVPLIILAHSANANTEEAQVKQVVTAFQEAWNTHDMVKFGNLFAEDADFVNVVGMRWIGRSAIQEAHAKSHQTVFKNSQLTVRETIVRFVKPDVAVTRSVWELVGHISRDGKPGEPRKGILTHIVVKQNNKWEIIVTQNTDIVPIP